MNKNTALRVADLAQNSATRFELTPGSEDMQALAAELGLVALKKLRFCGEVTAQGTRDWLLTGALGATVVQPCVVTLDLVSTRIDITVRRVYLADLPETEADEVEMPEDDEVEPLRAVIDPAVVMVEALALALPLYPRKDDAELGEAIYAQPGVAPMRDEDARPFAGLAALRDKLKPGD
jgi:uncharacterized metal-binding protein YceD (DUF177 family)